MITKKESKNSQSQITQRGKSQARGSHSARINVICAADETLLIITWLNTDLLEGWKYTTSDTTAVHFYFVLCHFILLLHYILEVNSVFFTVLHLFDRYIYFEDFTQKQSSYKINAQCYRHNYFTAYRVVFFNLNQLRHLNASIYNIYNNITLSGTFCCIINTFTLCW